MGRRARTARTRVVGAVVVGLLLLAGCTSGSPGAGPEASQVPTTTTAPTGTAATTATTAPTDPTATAPTTSPAPPYATVDPDDPGPGPLGADVVRPPAGVAWDGSVVVLVHGGAWVGGTPSLLGGWARALAEEGSLVVNASYRLVGQGGGAPASVDDVACAVRLAGALARQELGTVEPELRVTLVGHSAGAHLSALVALAPDAYGGDCPYPPVEVGRLVGLGGIYDVRELGFLFTPFVGVPSADDPALWSSVNPVEVASSVDRPELEVVLVRGGLDTLVPAEQATAFEAALDGRVASVAVVEVPAADHLDLQRPGEVGLDVVRGGAR